MGEVIRLMLLHLYRNTFHSAKTNMIKHQPRGYQTEVTSLSKNVRIKNNYN